MVVSPGSGSGSAQTFTLTNPDPAGFARAAFGWVQFLIVAASDAGGQPFCFVHYDRAGNGFADVFKRRKLLPGAGGTGTTSTALSSNACSVNTAEATVAKASGILVVTLPDPIRPVR